MAKTKEILVNGQLTQVTEFDHSAQEIDNAVGKVKGGAAALGAAPAGFGGFGEPTVNFGKQNTLEALYAALDAQLEKMPNDSMCGVRLSGIPEIDTVPWYFGTLTKYTNSVAWLQLYTYTSNAGIRLVDIQKFSDWGEVEWVNPPMNLGDEYRTTERYLGGVVYKKVISMTTIGDSRATAVVAENAQIFRTSFKMPGSGFGSSSLVAAAASNFTNWNYNRVNVSFKGNTVHIDSGGTDWNGTTCYVYVEYIKTTA